MRIAIHASDLDQQRIDGTRVYILNLLKNFGKVAPSQKFFIYHQNEFNPHLAPPTFENYSIKKIFFPKFWTQTRFALQLFFDKPDVLWMPVHNVPFLRRKKMKVVVTIHDLAFKIFPQYFPKKELKKLNRLTDHAINNADRIIAVSGCTKKDILKFYPEVKDENIIVIHHGFDSEVFQEKTFDKEKDLFSKFKIQNSKFILYVGAIQPRKDLETLIEAFEKLKEKEPSNLQLVIAGAPAWNYQQTLEKIKRSKYSKDIVVTGTLPFEEIKKLYHGAAAFVFPSLYEGFGIPVLEAFACGVPVILADNSSLLEIGKDAALFFKTGDSDDLQRKIETILADDQLTQKLIKKGHEEAKKYSWEKCAQQTCHTLTDWQ